MGRQFETIDDACGKNKGQRRTPYQTNPTRRTLLTRVMTTAGGYSIGFPVKLSCESFDSWPQVLGSRDILLFSRASVVNLGKMPMHVDGYCQPQQPPHVLGTHPPVLHATSPFCRWVAAACVFSGVIKTRTSESDQLNQGVLQCCCSQPAAQSDFEGCRCWMEAVKERKKSQVLPSPLVTLSSSIDHAKIFREKAVHSRHCCTS